MGRKKCAVESVAEMKPWISVIMLTYNREQYVRRAVESILNQTFEDYEFILVDNGSTDRSGKICDEFQTQDSRVRVLHLPKGSIGSGRNAGLDIAQGEYISFIDDDDYAAADFLQFLFLLARDYQADIAVCGSYAEQNGIVAANGKYSYDNLYVLNTEQAVEAFLRRNYYNAAMPTKLIRRELFERTRFPDKGNYDDITTTYRVFANAGVVVTYGLPKYTFFRHPGNHSSSATKHNLLNSAQLFEYISAFAERTVYISNTLPQLTDLAKYSEWSYMISMIDKIYRYNLKNCRKPLEVMKKELRLHWKEFYESTYIEEFEKEWLDNYVRLNDSD